MRFSHYIAGILLAAVMAHSAFAATTDLQMLPPVGADNTTTCGSKNAAGVIVPTGVLYWDGTTPMHCIPGFSGDVSSGTVTVGSGNSGTLNVLNSMYLGGTGSTNGPLNNITANMLLTMQAQNCGPNEALTINSDKTVHCVTIIDLASIIGGSPAKALVPSCQATGTALTWDGSQFTCQASEVPSCPTGQVLVGALNGAAQCAPASCPSGQVLVGINSAGTPPTCIAAPSNNPCTGVNFAGTATFSTDGTTATGTCNPVCPAGSAFLLGNYVCYGADGCEFAWNTPGGVSTTPPVTFGNGKIGDTVSAPDGYALTALCGSFGSYYGNGRGENISSGMSPVVPVNGAGSIFLSMTCTTSGWQANWNYNAFGASATVLDGYAWPQGLFSQSGTGGCPAPPPPPPPPPDDSNGACG